MMIFSQISTPSTTPNSRLQWCLDVLIPSSLKPSEPSSLTSHLVWRPERKRPNWAMKIRAMLRWVKQLTGTQQIYLWASVYLIHHSPSFPNGSKKRKTTLTGPLVTRGNVPTGGILPLSKVGNSVLLCKDGFGMEDSSWLSTFGGND